MQSIRWPAPSTLNRHTLNLYKNLVRTLQSSSVAHANVAEDENFLKKTVTAVAGTVSKVLVLLWSMSCSIGML